MHDRCTMLASNLHRTVRRSIIDNDNVVRIRPHGVDHNANGSLFVQSRDEDGDGQGEVQSYGVTKVRVINDQ